MKNIILAIVLLFSCYGVSFGQKVIDYYLDGLRKAGLEDYHGAIKNYNKVLKLTPNDTACYYARAIAKSKIGDSKGALKDFDKAIELNPFNPLYYSVRAHVKSTNNNHKGAIEDFTKAINLDPKRDEDYFSRASEKAELKDNLGAIADFDEAIKLKEYPVYYYMRGIARYNNGDKKGGCADMKKSVDLGFSKITETMKQMCD